MPLLVTGHEDKYIRVFDLSTGTLLYSSLMTRYKHCFPGQCTQSILAHLDAVTSVSLDASGFSLVSGSHDCSIRFWDILNSRSCVQEVTPHREKAREGVLAVEFHPTLPVMATGGADSLLKLYASS